MRYFVRGIPDELIQTVRIDGYGYLRMFARIMLPLAKPALTAAAVLSFVYHWNDYLGSLIYLNDQSLYPVSKGLGGFSSM